MYLLKSFFKERCVGFRCIEQYSCRLWQITLGVSKLSKIIFIITDHKQTPVNCCVAKMELGSRDFLCSLTPPVMLRLWKNNSYWGILHFKFKVHLYLTKKIKQHYYTAQSQPNISASCVVALMRGWRSRLIRGGRGWTSTKRHFCLFTHGPVSL